MWILLYQFLSLLAYLELYSRSAYDYIVRRPSVRERFTFSTSPPRAISWIELNHSGCGGGGGGKGGGEGALRQHGDSELLRSFRSDIQDGRHGGYLEIL